MSTQPIAFATTPVSPEKTAMEIEDILREGGASKVAKVFDQGRVKSVYFQMDTKEGSLPFRLPIVVDPVYQILLDSRKKFVDQDARGRLHQQAERTAWRIVHWWVKAQVAFIQAGQVTVTQVFLPYMLVGEDVTVYDRLASGGFKALAATEQSL